MGLGIPFGVSFVSVSLAGHPINVLKGAVVFFTTMAPAAIIVLLWIRTLGLNIAPEPTKALSPICTFPAVITLLARCAFFLMMVP